MDPKVLVVDDNVGLLSVLRLGLELRGFEVTTASGGKQGLRRAYQVHPDAIVLDVTMPEMDGWETCERLRAVTDAPVIMLSGRGDTADVIKGLSVGADDYMIKPCRLEELAARINAHLRRRAKTTAKGTSVVYDDGHLRIDLGEDLVFRDGKQVELSPIEYRLLAHLVRQKGRIVPGRDLLISAWGLGYADALSQLRVYICYLRSKVEDDPSHPRYIRTRWRVGYYFSRNTEIT
jgi:two-component system KDP operon response regulator KdpE